MKLIYTHPNRLIVENVKNSLENAGIGVQLQNEYAAGGVGELAPIDAWPELWLVDEKDSESAQQIIEALGQEQKIEWVCPDCQEKNAGSFELCWACGREQEAS